MRKRLERERRKAGKGRTNIRKFLFFLSTFFLFYGCDLVYRVSLVNETNNSLVVKVRYDSLSEIRNGFIDTIVILPKDTAYMFSDVGQPSYKRMRINSLEASSSDTTFSIKDKSEFYRKITLGKFPDYYLKLEFEDTLRCEVEKEYDYISKDSIPYNGVLDLSSKIIKDGFWRFYYVNGVLAGSGSFLNNLPVDEHKIFSINGELNEIYFYSKKSELTAIVQLKNGRPFKLMKEVVPFTKVLYHTAGKFR
jgi:hypothetical protein